MMVWAAMVAAVRVQSQNVCAPWPASPISSAISPKAVAGW